MVMKLVIFTFYCSSFICQLEYVYKEELLINHLFTFRYSAYRKGR